MKRRSDSSGKSITAAERNGSKLRKFPSVENLDIVKNRFLPAPSLDAFIEESYASVASKIASSGAKSCGLLASQRAFSASLPTPSFAVLAKSDRESNCKNKVNGCGPETSISNSLAASNYETNYVQEEASIMDSPGVFRTFTVGRLSVLMLLVMTCTDFAFNAVNAQMHRLESTPDYYDTLSTEVISPPFLYHEETPAAKTTKKGRPRAGLGLAAISSITDVLSPILPCVGGIDLRREENWNAPEKNLFKKVLHVVGQARDAFRKDRISCNHRPANASAIVDQIPRAGGQSPSSLKSKFNSAISAKTPFVSYDKISELTLGDVTTVFRYAIESSKHNFNEKKFFSGLLPRVKSVLVAVDDAVSKSRGKNVKPARVVSDGDLDALKFCAIMRIFGEWRILRLVPDGYKGYAVGMNLGHKDIVQNVAKMEEAAHVWIDHRREFDSSDLRSPTLGDLLAYEAETEVHPKLPVLKEKSAAMGLLWVKRQLAYQTSLMRNILGVPNEYKTTRDAIEAAYSEVFNKYHGWAIQKIFTYSFQAAPEADIIYRFMNPHRLKDVVKEYETKSAPSLFCSDTIEDSQRPSTEGFFVSLASEWGKFLGRQQPSSMEPVEVSRGGSDHATCEGDNVLHLDTYVKEKMTEDAHDNIVEYLTVAQPLLSDLFKLINGYNMNDPSKV